jgi:hypothetical protein
MTDKQSSPHPGLPGPATLLDHTYSFPVPCAATGSTSVGSTCSLTTTFDARVPGSILERQRAIWELGRVEVHDAGGPFLIQGVFVP